jgi:hypothetical protein
MIVRELETSIEAPFLGKEGSAMLEELWKAQMEWLTHPDLELLPETSLVLGSKEQRR